MVVSLVALFVALGGASYAAVFLPPNSVGSAQIQFHAVNGNKIGFLSVGFRKIQFGAVGIRRINPNQVQARINGACAPFSAVSTVDGAGNVTCNATLPAEIGTGTAATTVGTTAATVASAPLPGGPSYMIMANPQADVTAASGQVRVDCTLAAGSSTQTRSVTFQGGATPHQLGSMPLTITVPSAVNGSTATVSCLETPPAGVPATVTVTTNINAIQISSISTPAAAMARAAAARK